MNYSAESSGATALPPTTTLDDETFGGVILGSLIGLALGGAGLIIALGVVGLSANTQSYWYLSRSAGFVAYLLLWGSVVWGLLLSSGIGKGVLRAPALLDAHQFLSNMAVGFTLFHSLVLLGDRHLSLPLSTLLIPFASDYKPALVAAGQIGLWLSLLVIVSFYVRKQLGQPFWRAVHYGSFVAYAAALLHAVAMGSDSWHPFVQALYLASAGAVLFLTLYRLLAKDDRTGKRPAPGPAGNAETTRQTSRP